MKVLFTVPGKGVRLADKDRLVLDFYRGHYFGNFYDINGNAMPAEDSIDEQSDDIGECPWDSEWIQAEGLEEKLVAESVEDIVWELNEGFGKFGFKNRAGEYVIEPQYAYADQFTCGLAAVNLNRTWYRTKEGRRYYENHFGYINERGETVIPFAYAGAWPFNKYHVAVVEDRKGSHLIDTEGKVIPGTEKLSISHYYDYCKRFLEFTFSSDNDNEKDLVGIYDTKERKILLEPSISGFHEWAEDYILVYASRADADKGIHQYYINSKGEKLFPWLIGKGFAKVEIPNKLLVSIVALSEDKELPGHPYSIYTASGKYYKREYWYGIYSSKERYIIPPEYERIDALTDRIFGCVKNGMVTIVQLEDSDLQ